MSCSLLVSIYLCWNLMRLGMSFMVAFMFFRKKKDYVNLFIMVSNATVTRCRFSLQLIKSRTVHEIKRHVPQCLAVLVK